MEFIQTHLKYCIETSAKRIHTKVAQFTNKFIICQDFADFLYLFFQHDFAVSKISCFR